MKILQSHRLWLLIIIIVQTSLIFTSFNKLIFEGEEYLIMDAYDGMRNYYAYYEYIQEPASDEVFQLQKMNYPFGEYIFYTDNTPLLAFAVKWFSENIVDVKAHSFQIFHWFFVFSILIASILLFFIGKPFIKTPTLLIIFSLTIPWITPQLFRLGNGHFSLALTACILSAMYGLIGLYRNYEAGERGLKIALPIIGIIASTVISTFLHGYFLPINGFMIGYFCLAWAIAKWGNIREVLRISAMALFIPLTCLFSAMGIILSIDDYYALRSPRAEGFYYDQWQLKFDGLHFDYGWHTIPSFIHTRLDVHYESFAYVGAFALYGFFILMGVFIVKAIIRKSPKSILNEYIFKNKEFRPVWLLMIAGFGCLWIAFGETAYFFENRLKFDNVLNPLYWLVKVSDRVTQFRCMGRFNWGFFLTLQLFLVAILDQYYQKNTQNWWRRILVIVLPALLLVDMWDTVVWSKQFAHPNPLTHPDRITQIKNYADSLDIDKYQAILPLPYFNTGSEDYDYNIDPIDHWSTTIYQLSSATQLPMLLNKSGRTPLPQTYAQFDILLNYEISPLIREQLSTHPILVAYSTNETAWQGIPNFETAKKALLNGKDFALKKELKQVAAFDGIIFYEWDWNAAQ